MPVAPDLSDPSKALEALSALGKGLGVTLGPVVNWRELVAFLPDRLGTLSALEQPEGSTSGIAQMQLTRVERRYADGTARVRIEILDTSLSPLLRAPFAVVQLVHDDSSKGYRRGTQIKAQPAISTWKSAAARSELSLLAAGRFLINIEVDGARDGQAEAIASALDLTGIMALAPHP